MPEGEHGRETLTGANDSIEIRDFEVLAFCGVLPEEKERRQPFSVDLDIFLNLETAGRSDNLADTVDYGALLDRLTKVLGGAGFSLLEAMANTIAAITLSGPMVEAVTVRVRKLRPPVAAHVATTGVRIHRTQPSS